MDKLVDILNEYDANENDVAEMLYAYLCEYGEDKDHDLLIAIYTNFFKKEC